MLHLQTVPMGMNFTTDITTTDALLALFNNANSTIDIVIYYFNLLGGMVRENSMCILSGRCSWYPCPVVVCAGRLTGPRRSNWY